MLTPDTTIIKFTTNAAWAEERRKAPETKEVPIQFANRGPDLKKRGVFTICPMNSKDFQAPFWIVRKTAATHASDVNMELAEAAVNKHGCR